MPPSIFTSFLTMRDDSASKMAPWDPVWEFILDDYENSDGDSSSERRDWFEKRSERNETDRWNTSKANKQQAREENNSGVDMPTANGGESKEKKAKGLLRRFQRNKTNKETTKTAQTKTTPSPTTEPKSARPNPPKSKVQQQKSLAEDLNPFGIFLENTEKLGPLGADQDSNSESSSGSNSSQSDGEAVGERRIGTAESFSRSPTRIEEPEREVTEIRLSFTPMREDPIENDSGNISNSYQGEHRRRKKFHLFS